LEDNDAMAQPPNPGTAPLTEEAFYADRAKFWGDFTGATKLAVAGVVILLLLLLIFLV
jgi:hypothetical protein